MKLRQYLKTQKTSTLIKLRDWLTHEIKAREKLENFDFDRTLDGIEIKELTHGSPTTPE